MRGHQVMVASRVHIVEPFSLTDSVGKFPLVPPGRFWKAFPSGLKVTLPRDTPFDVLPDGFWRARSDFLLAQLDPTPVVTIDDELREMPELLGIKFEDWEAELRSKGFLSRKGFLYEGFPPHLRQNPSIS